MAAATGKRAGSPFHDAANKVMYGSGSSLGNASLAQSSTRRAAAGLPASSSASARTPRPLVQAARQSTFGAPPSSTSHHRSLAEFDRTSTRHPESRSPSAWNSDSDWK